MLTSPCDLDRPPFDDLHSFRYWRRQGYVPTARLDGRKEWGEVCHLRCQSDSSVVACPNNIAGVLALERLHQAVVTRTFFDPKTAHDTGTIYVTLIPRPVVDWFSTCTTSDVHEQIVLYLGLHIALGGDQALILRDTARKYHDKIVKRVDTLLRDHPDLRNDEHVVDLSRYTSSLPPWFRPEQVTYDNRRLWTLPPLCHIPWPRRTNRWDTFGIINYRLTEVDEKRIDDHESDPLDRAESCPDAFEHLLYARHAKDAWATMFQSEDDNTGAIYLIQDGRGRVKIGWTDSTPAKRLAALQTGNADTLRLLGTIPGTREQEKYLHARYADQKARDERTEWFCLTPADVLEILRVS